MRTALALTVSRGGVPAWSGAVYLPGPGGMYLPGLGGVPAWSGGYLPGPGEGGVYLVRHSSLVWTEFLTHASENITLPQTSFAGGKHAKKIYHAFSHCSGS